jgi:PAS domain S-box-containing protein
MTTTIGKILVLDDEGELKNILVEALTSHGYETTGFTSGVDALAVLRQEAFDILLTDLMMPAMDGITLVKEALLIDPNMVPIMMTGQGTIQTAVDAMKVGTFDYVLKPFRIQTMLPVLTRAMNTRHLRLENVQLREAVAIHELSETIAFTLDPKTVLSKLADAALQQSEAEEVSILLPVPDSDEFYVAAVRGEKRERLLGERVPFGRSISSWVARQGEPVILNGEVNDDRFVALWPRPDIRSSVSIPMLVARKLVGVLNLNVLDRPRPFTLGQMKALTILAGTAAAALESASLYTQVQQAERNYRSIFENAVEGIFQSTSAGKFIAANPAMARILGYESPEELITAVTDIGRQVYVHPNARIESAQLQKEFGLLQGFEFEAFQKSGDKIWLSLNRRSVRDEKGNELYHEGTIEDITENKRAEERVRQSEKQLAEAQHLAHVGSWNWDLEKNLVTWSEEYYRIMGVEREQFDPNFDSVLDLCASPDDRELLKTAVSQIRENHNPFSIEYRVRRPDGEICTIDARGYVLTDKEDNPIRMFGTAQDVTERVKAEAEEARLQAELRQQTERVATIVATVPGVVFEAWGQPGESKADFVSEYVEPMLGYSVSEWLSTPRFWLSVVHPDDRDRVASEAAFQFHDSKNGEIEFRWVGKDGRIVWVRAHTMTIRDDDGNPLGVRGVVTDITERTRAEEALRDSEERYRDLFASNPLPMWVYDIETMAFLEVNDAAVSHYGYSREEFLSMTILDIRPPDNTTALLENIANLGEGLDNAGIWKHLTKDGRTIQVEITSHVLNFGGRHAELVLANDVTDRLRAEEMRMRRTEHVALRAEISSALAQSNIPLPTILDRCALALVQHLGAAFARIWTLNKEDDVLELQASAGLYTHIDGVHSRVPVGKFKIGLIAQEREPHITNNVQTDPRVNDKEWAKRKGMVAFAGYPLIVEDRLVGVVAMFARQHLADDTLDALASVADIISQGIERKRAEQELSNSEERYRDLVENAHDIIYSHDLDGNYTSMNQAGQIITGYTREEALKLNLSQTVAPEHIVKARSMLSHKLEGEQVTAYEMEILAKDGHAVTVEVNTRLVTQDGIPVGVQGIARDITERKRLEIALHESEQQLRQSQKLEAIGQLAGGVAHDFNNLLTAINGYSALALRRLGNDHPISSYLEEIKKAGDRAANLTRQLLAFGRKQLLQPLALNVNDIVTDMIKLLKRLIGEDVQLITRPAANLKQIKADPGQLEQVLVNLVVNARDAMPMGGTVTIETANTILDGAYASSHLGVRAGEYVMLAISDTGTGMDQETQSRIFEPFFTTKEKDKGTGLGLSTVYGIIRQSGGNIWVYSELGKGTTFKVYLPLIADEVTKQNEAIPAPLIKRGSETVMLVEDEDMVRKLASELLVDAGYTVLEANGGEEAIKLCTQHSAPIDLLITDVVMPKMSGKQVAEQLLVLHPETKVLFMSGYTDEAIVHHGMIDSNIAFIQKPFSERALAQKIRDVLDVENGHK